MRFDTFEENFCLRRAIKWFKKYGYYKKREYLLYCALDMRFCIERTLFIYLVLIKNFELSERLEKLYAANDLRQAILNEEPNFIKKVEFVGLITKYIYPDRDVVVPNLDLISASYGIVGNYLHTPKRPERTSYTDDWWAKLYGALEKILPHMGNIYSGLIADIDFNDDGDALFKDYLEGRITKAEVQEKLGTVLKNNPPQQQ